MKFYFSSKVIRFARATTIDWKPLETEQGLIFDNVLSTLLLNGTLEGVVRRVKLHTTGTKASTTPYKPQLLCSPNANGLLNQKQSSTAQMSSTT
jgi:hypothetical protein